MRGKERGQGVSDGSVCVCVGGVRRQGGPQAQMRGEGREEAEGQERK